MRFPKKFVRYVGTIPTGGIALGADAVPSTGPKQSIDNMLETRFINIHGWPAHRIAVGYHYAGVGPAVDLTGKAYIYDENSGFWYLMPPTAGTTMKAGEVVFFDSVCAMEGAQNNTNRLDNNASPGGLEVLLIITGPGGEPNGTYTFPMAADLSTGL